MAYVSRISKGHRGIYGTGIYCRHRNGGDQGVGPGEDVRAVKTSSLVLRRHNRWLWPSSNSSTYLVRSRPHGMSYIVINTLLPLHATHVITRLVYNIICVIT
jgi:hypothetical protein